MLFDKKIIKFSLKPILYSFIFLNITLIGIITLIEFILNHSIVLLNDYISDIGNRLDNYINNISNKKIIKFSLKPILYFLYIIYITLMGIITLIEFILNYSIVLLNKYITIIGNRLDNYINNIKI